MSIEFEIGISDLFAIAVIFTLGTIMVRFGVYLTARMRTIPTGHFLRYLIATSFKCDHCRKSLPVSTWMPIIAWLRPEEGCMLCGGRTPWVVKPTELIVGLISALIPIIGDWTLESLSMVFTLWLCFIVSWVDLKHFVIPQFGTLILLFTGLLWSPFEVDPLMRSSGAAVSALCMWLSFTFIGIFKDVDTDSGGDISLIAGAGAWVGFNYLPLYLVASSSIYLIHALAVKKSTGNLWVAMAPALSAGLLTTQLILLLDWNF